MDWLATETPELRWRLSEGDDIHLILPHTRCLSPTPSPHPSAPTPPPSPPPCSGARTEVKSHPPSQWPDSRRVAPSPAARASLAAPVVAMTGHLREQSMEDEEGEGGAAESRIRHASCEEDLSSAELASPHQAGVPEGAADARLTLPTTLPATHDSSVTTSPEYRPQSSRAAPLAIVPAAGPSLWLPAMPPACPHRRYVSVGGPPCYLCSVLDLPPKYCKREARGWQRVKEKLVRFSMGSLAPREAAAASRGQGPPAYVYTVNELSPHNALGSTTTQRTASSPTVAPPGCWAPQERENSATDTQETREGSGPAAHPATEGGPTSPLPPVLHPSRLEFVMSPPPYSPTPPNRTHLPPHYQPRDSLPSPYSIRCGRHM